MTSGKTFILGIGAMKAGTTWLYDYLSSLGEVASSPLKEVHYFDVEHRPDLFRRRVNRNWRALKKEVIDDKMSHYNKNELIRSNIERLYMQYYPDAYLQHFYSLQDLMTTHYCEFTPSYALLPIDAYERIRCMFHEAGLQVKIIFILRDPVDRHWSQIRFEARKNKYKKKQMMDHLSTLEDPHWIERGRYDLTIQNLQKTFSESEFHIEFYEHLFSHSSVIRILDFLGLSMNNRRPDFSKVVGATKLNTDIPVEFLERAKLEYGDVYEWCLDYFDGRLPSNWLCNKKV